MSNLKTKPPPQVTLETLSCGRPIPIMQAYYYQFRIKRILEGLVFHGSGKKTEPQKTIPLSPVKFK